MHPYGEQWNIATLALDQVLVGQQRNRNLLPQDSNVPTMLTTMYLKSDPLMGTSDIAISTTRVLEGIMTTVSVLKEQ